MVVAPLDVMCVKDCHQQGTVAARRYINAAKLRSLARSKMAQALVPVGDPSYLFHRSHVPFVCSPSGKAWKTIHTCWLR